MEPNKSVVHKSKGQAKWQLFTERCRVIVIATQEKDDAKLTWKEDGKKGKARQSAPIVRRMR